MLTLKVIAALLHYPDEALQEHVEELGAALERERSLETGARQTLAKLIAQLHDEDLFELQARYVDTFDRGRACSLYLFEHVHGESRERGGAMIELRGVYRAAGFEISSPELPDYLPLFLEFLSTRPVEEARGWLAQVGSVVQLLHARLLRRASPYAAALVPVLALAGLETEDTQLREQIAGEVRDDTPEALDRAWAEAPVSFGPVNQGNPWQNAMSAERPCNARLRRAASVTRER